MTDAETAPPTTGSATRSQPASRRGRAARRVPASGRGAGRFSGAGRFWSTARRRARQLRSLDGLMLLVAVLATIGRVRPLAPGVRLDPAWELAINLTRRDHLQWGPDVVFTYGPWGWLDYPVAVSRVHILFSLLFGVFAMAVLWYALRRSFTSVLSGWWPAVAATAAAVLIYPPDQSAGGISGALVLGVALLLLQFLLLDHARPDSGVPRAGEAVRSEVVTRTWIPAFAAASAAGLLQLKISEGIALTAVVAVAVVCSPRQPVRRSVEALVSFVVVSIVAWLAAGQHLANYPQWLRSSLAVALYFGDAMATDSRPFLFGYLVVAFFILVSLGYLFRLARADYPWRVKIGAILISLGATYFGFKEATTRHDAPHESAFWLLITATLVALVGLGRSRTFRVAVLVGALVIGSSDGVYLHPVTDLNRLTSSANLVLDGTYQRSVLSTARAQAKLAYHVAPRLLARIGHQPVQVDGFGSTLPWAYDLNWRPAPVFQSYSAYSASLDELNARKMVDSPAGQLILRPTATAIDGRNSLWDPPRYVLAEMCHFRVVATANGWQLLAKAGNRCSAAQQLTQQHVVAGQRIVVPTGGQGSILTMSFTESDPGLVSKLGRALFKPLSPLQATADGTAYRLPRALSGGPLVVSVPTTVGWGRSFGGATKYRVVSFSRPGTVRFDSVTVS